MRSIMLSIFTICHYKYLKFCSKYFFKGSKRYVQTISKNVHVKNNIQCMELGEKGLQGGQVEYVCKLSKNSLDSNEMLQVAESVFNGD